MTLAPNEALLVEVPLVSEFATFGIFAAGKLDRDFKTIGKQVAKKEGNTLNRYLTEI